MTKEIEDRIIKAYERLNGEKPTAQQVKDIYAAFKDCGLLK